jgi:3-methyladenine DNA glycosylase AlkD
VRALAREYKALSLAEIASLLDSRLHEVRLLALCLLTNRFAKADEKSREKIYRLYLKKKARINNWDLVDVSAAHIVGGFLEKRPRQILYQLSQSSVLWEKRIAIIATHHFIRRNDFTDVLKLAKKYLHEEHDLMHKATGWMLREVGKRNEKTLTQFLDKHHKIMPRTMLRYAIERLTPAQRKKYMAK